jgi:hypothetical protein
LRQFQQLSRVIQDILLSLRIASLHLLLHGSSRHRISIILVA